MKAFLELFRNLHWNSQNSLCFIHWHQSSYQFILIMMKKTEINLHLKAINFDIFIGYGTYNFNIFFDIDVVHIMGQAVMWGFLARMSITF